MPFNVDPNAVYPVGSVILIVLFSILGLKIFPTQKEVESRISALEIKIAERYVLKDDVDKKLDDLSRHMNDQLADIKQSIVRVFDKLDEVIRR